MKTINPEFKNAWDVVFANLTSEQQDAISAAPDGSNSVKVTRQAERLVDARRAAKGKGAGRELQLVERLEMENPL